VYLRQVLHVQRPQPWGAPGKAAAFEAWDGTVSWLLDSRDRQRGQVRQLPASREQVLPYVCWQRAAAEVQVLQLAAGHQGGEGSGRHCSYIRCCKTASQAQVLQLLQVLQVGQQLCMCPTLCTINTIIKYTARL
jgi:hypothetical protein